MKTNFALTAKVKNVRPGQYEIVRWLSNTIVFSGKSGKRHMMTMGAWLAGRANGLITE